MALNEPPADGMRVRRAIGTELSSPFGAVNCTDSGPSPGAWGRAMLRGTLAELRGGMVIVDRPLNPLEPLRRRAHAVGYAALATLLDELDQP